MCVSFVAANPMATTSPATASKSSNQSFCTTPISSSFFKTVCLQDWWLVKADLDFNGKRLAVGGIASIERHTPREFSSAPIVKRLDTFTLETSDGFTIAIMGLINWSRTHQNGFSMEVCDHFQLGFPYYWEDYSAQYFGTCTGGVPTNISDFNKQIMYTFNGGDHDLPRHFHELPVTKLRVHLMSSPGISDNCVLTEGFFNDILQKLSSNDSTYPGENGRMLESTRVLFAEEQNNLNCDGLNDPESIVAGKSTLPENNEVNLLEVELQMPSSTSDVEEVSAQFLDSLDRQKTTRSGRKY